MRRIATTTAAADLWGVGKNGFRAGNPAVPILPTQFSADWCNDLQETVLNPIEEAGLVASADVTQLTQAIQALASIGGAISLTATTVLTRGQRGLVQVNASAANVDITLPAADRVMDFIIRRVDNTGNRLRVYAAGADMILHNVDINASGYPFIRLFGAGDFWLLRSDGAGNWIPLSRLAPMPVGLLPAHSANLYPSGGFAPVNGAIFVRADYPWLWDLANASGNIDTEANWAASKWGGYSTGDTATTFRVLELRGEFIRIWDNSRGVDAGRGIGTSQLDALQNITGQFSIISANSAPSGSGAFSVTAGSAAAGDSAPYAGGIVHFDASLVARTAAETRPRSIALPKLLKII